MGCTVSRLKAEGATRVCVTSLEDSCQTGDLVLFSSRHAASQMTKCFTASAWDHCGLVVKLSPKHVLILEYAGGVYLYPLFTRLYSYYAIQGREIVIRRLKTKEPRSEMQQQVESFVKSVLGQKPPSIEEMVMAVLKQDRALNAFISKLRGSKEIEDDLSSLFCSKLVAAVYKHVGLIGPDRTLGDFLPKHFSAQYDGYVDLQGGAKLGPEITISFDAVQAEVDEVKMRVAERERIQPEAVLSLVNSIYLTARESCSDLASSMKIQSTKLHSSTDRELMLKLSSLKGVKLSCLPGNRSDTDLARVARSSGGKGAGDDDDDRVSTASPVSTATDLTPSNTEPPTAASSPKSKGSSRLMPGGVEITSGSIVVDVQNVNDGGIYSPMGSAGKASGQRRAQLR